MFVATANANAQTTTGAHDATANTHEGVLVHDEGPGAFPPFDSASYPSQLLWLAITFGLFYVFLNKVVMPRIGGILEVRRDRIAHDLDTASRMNEDADAASAAYEQELADARAKSHKIAQDARDKAKAEADAERLHVETGLNAKLAEAETRIAEVRSSAMKDVGAIAEETASAIVQSLVGGKGDQAAIASAVKSIRK